MPIHTIEDYKDENRWLREQLYKILQLGDDAKWMSHENGVAAVLLSAGRAHQIAKDALDRIGLYATDTTTAEKNQA